MCLKKFCEYEIFTIDLRVILSIIVATGVYALLLKILEKNSPHNCSNERGGGGQRLFEQCSKLHFSCTKASLSQNLFGGKMDMQGLRKGVLTSFKIQKGQWIQNEVRDFSIFVKSHCSESNERWEMLVARDWRSTNLPLWTKGMATELQKEKYKKERKWILSKIIVKITKLSYPKCQV